MSNYKAGENPARRIPKVSHATAIDVGLVGPKARPKGVTDGQQVNIPAPCENQKRILVDNLTSLCPVPFWICKDFRHKTLDISLLVLSSV
jgi:hypothetical protein